MMNQELRENNRRITELLIDRQASVSSTGKRPVTAMRA
jgi:hypothetical protein